MSLLLEDLGRRNWLFAGSDDGALVNTVFVSLLASAGLHGIEPLAYLRDLLCLLPSWPRHRLLELAPAYWKQTFEQAETQQRLAANVFRRVILSPPSCLPIAGHDLPRASSIVRNGSDRTLTC
jgi:transposase